MMNNQLNIGKFTGAADFKANSALKNPPLTRQVPIGFT